MVKKGQSQRQTQIVNVNVKGDKKAKRRRGKKVNRKEGKPETRIIPAFNPPPIINYPPAFNQQFNPNQWLTPPAPAPPKIAPKVLVESETAETLGVPAYTPVDLTIESRFRTAEPAPDIAERAVAERAVEPFPPAEFVPSSSPLVDPETEPPVLLPPEPLSVFPDDLSALSGFPREPPTGTTERYAESLSGFASPRRLPPGETLPPLPPITPASEGKRRGRPPGAKNKPKAVGVEFEPVVGELLVPPEAGIPLGQLSPSEYTAIPPRTFSLGRKKAERATSAPGLGEGEGYFSPSTSPQPISFLGEGFQAEPRKNPLERQRQEGFSGKSGIGETIAPSESYLFTEA